MTKDEEKKLSQQQIKYVRERLMQIRDAKLKEVDDEYEKLTDFLANNPGAEWQLIPWPTEDDR